MAKQLRKPPLTVAQVLAWADAHRERTGDWPGVGSGPVEGAPGLSWRALNSALWLGTRGLPGGDSLARLLRRQRGMPERRGLRRRGPGRRQEAARLRAEGLTLKEIAARRGSGGRRGVR
jgi:hypothetical protein